jgi:hypothetical protein
VLALAGLMNLPRVLPDVLQGPVPVRSWEETSCFWTLQKNKDAKQGVGCLIIFPVGAFFKIRSNTKELHIYSLLLDSHPSTLNFYPNQGQK